MRGLAGAKRAILRFAEGESAVHAVLLYGARGSGKGQLANVLASAWLAPNQEPSQAATAFENGRNPDVLHVEPFGAGRMILGRQISPSRGAEGNFEGISVIEFLRTAPIMSASKVVIVHEAERLHPAAANALLKTLEEPHPYSKFILMTNAVGSLLPTILSRCVAIACELPREGERGDLDLPSDFWNLANGAPGRAIRFSENAKAYENLLNFARGLRGRGRREALLASEQFKEIAESIQGEQAVRAANAEALELLGNAVAIYHPEWHAARREIAEAHRRILGNGNAGLTLDSLFAGLLAV